MMAHGLLTELQRESKLAPQVSLPSWLSRPRHWNARCKLLAQGSTSWHPTLPLPTLEDPLEAPLSPGSPRVPSVVWSVCVCRLRVYRAHLAAGCPLPARLHGVEPPSPGL